MAARGRKIAMVGTLLLVLATGIVGPAAFAARVSSADSCTAPPADPALGTAAWTQREVENLACAQQGFDDGLDNPVYLSAFEQMRTAWAGDEGRGTEVRGDPLRYPSRYWAGTRGTYQQVWISTAGGGRFPAEVFAPLPSCRPPCRKTAKGLEHPKPPYPLVVLEHGGGAFKEMYWQTAEVVAEAGYVVVNIDAFGTGNGSVAPTPAPSEPLFLFAARTALDYALASPAQPTATGQFNPLWKLADQDRVALLGASLGANTVSHLGQVDRRVDTVVAYDSCEYVLDALGRLGPDPTSIDPSGGGCRSRPATVAPEELRTSRLTISADYFKASDVPRSAPPDPHHKDEYTRDLVAQGVDAMQVSVRAGTHADIVDDTPDKINKSRYGQAVSNYFTLAWLEYQLQGQHDKATRREACRRLTASTFDRFADIHEMGTGRYDPTRANPKDPESGNVVATVGGMPVPDRLSYLFASSLFLADGALRTDDLPNDPPNASSCSKLP